MCVVGSKIPPSYLKPKDTRKSSDLVHEPRKRGKERVLEERLHADFFHLGWVQWRRSHDSDLRGEFVAGPEAGAAEASHSQHCVLKERDARLRLGTHFIVAQTSF